MHSSEVDGREEKRREEAAPLVSVGQPAGALPTTPSRQDKTAHDKLHAHHPQAWVCTHAVSVIPNPEPKVRVTGRKESELEWNQG